MNPKGKKQIASELFSFVCEQYLTSVQTGIIKEALKKCASLIDTLDEEKQVKNQEVIENKNVVKFEKRKEQEQQIIKKSKRKPRSDKREETRYKGGR